MTPRRGHSAIGALARRDLRRYFSSPIGYVLVTLFVLVSGAAAFWRPAFFLNSLANLDQLNQDFPWILLLVVPAFSMTLWADERKQGTDELLLTLPATERDLVAGKYVAALGIYTVALAASASHVVVLWSLGHPDWGLLGANYLGFWLLGAGLIPAALLGSLVTANATIAFVLGTLFCALPIGMAEGAGTVSATTARRLAAFSVTPYFQDFTRGVVSLAAVVYFAGLAALTLYLGVLVLQHRRTCAGWPFARQAAARTAALATILGCAVVLSARTGARADMTLEKLYSLSGPTRSLVGALPPDRPVVIQAFISPEMPEPLVQTRENLVGVLHEIEARAGATVTLAIQEAEPYSPQARLARERYGILPRDVVDPATGETVHDVYLGVAVVSGPDEQVIPFFDRGLSPEYEVARALRVVTRAARKRVGILDSDARILGGADYRTNRPHPAWAAVQELRKEYDVVEVTPASAPDAKVDALVLVLPSRLTQTDLDLAMQPVARGIPTVLLLDPLPLFDLNLAPAADLASQIDPYRPAPSARTVFGNIRQALERIGINWVPARIVWDGFNPHPDMADLPQETLFVGVGNGNPKAFNPQDPATAHLQEVMFLYPGSLLPASTNQGSFTFESLVETGTVSGSSSFFDLVVPTQTGMAINGNISREPDHESHALAARVRAKGATAGAAGAMPVNVIAIADLDFISDYFFTARAAAPPNASFDNISFFLNAIDELAGDTSFIALRSHAGRHRTLERLDAQTRAFVDRRTREEHQADEEARVALDEARARLKQRVDILNARTDLDEQAKRTMVLNLQEAEDRQLRVLETGIDEAKGAKIRISRETMETEIRGIRRRIRALAVLLPPAPVLALGLVVFVRRTRRERQGEQALRRTRGAA